MPIDWGATLAEHDRRLRIAISSRLGERQAVDEVMQEVALAAVEQRAPLAESGKVGAWLRQIAIRQCLLYRRRRGRQFRLLDRFVRRGGEPTENGASPDPLDWLIQVERSQKVRTALSSLPGRDVEILLLKYTEHWSYRQLAEHLGIAESALETRLHRARQRLRESLARLNEKGVPE
jgi:RNA polymerase sigma factor (sigma-70 family)